MNNPVSWFEIYVENMERAKAFYESVFGVELTKLEGTEYEMWAFPMYPESLGAPGALIKIPGYSSGANSTVVYFHCDDCSAEVEKAGKAGGKVEMEKKSVGQYGFIALVVDTEGNIIGLHSMI